MQVNQQVAELERKLADAMAVIDALLSGQIDAVIDVKSQTPVLLAKAQDELRASEERYRRIVETTNEGVWLRDTENKTTFMNRRMAQMLGCEADMGLGRSADAFMDDDGRARVAAHLARPLEHRLELQHIRLDGRKVWTLMEIVPLFDRDGASDGSLAMVMDISQRKRAEAALLVSEARFRRLWDSGIILIAISDPAGHIVEINDAGLRMLGYSREELLGLGLRWNDLTPGSQDSAQAAPAELATTSVATPRETELIRKDGTRVSVLSATANLEGTEGIAIAVDMTDCKHAENANQELQEKLRQSQKMEAVGRLAGGIAHDFNNILTVILSCSEFIRTDLKPMDPLRMEADEICKAGHRAADLTRQLLMFSRQQVLEPKVLDLAVVTSDLASMLRRLLGEDIELVLLDAADLGSVCVDPGSMEQVIMNLVVNARDAMPKGGKLTIEMANAVVEEVSTDPLAPKPGPYVVLSVTDTGTGIDEATQARIFEPFFTTKAPGRGTGLGLSTVFGIVQQSQGTIHVRSAPGRGSTFRICLPRVEVEADAHADRPIAALHGTETILLVEDEDQVRAVVSNILKRHGYKTIDMRSPAEALAFCQARHEPIDLLVTDVVMPHMSGRELARSLVEIYPRLQCLYMSGYTDDRVVHHGVLQADIAFIQKPFTSESLGRKVRDVLALASDHRPTSKRSTAFRV